MKTLMVLVEPSLGALLGIVVFFSSEKIAILLQRAFEKFPRYDKSIFEQSSVRPIYVKMVGVMFFCVAILGIIARLGET